MNPPPSSLEPTPARGHPIICPSCGFQFPPIAKPAAAHAAQLPRTSARLNRGECRAPELEDATPTLPLPVNPRLADTDRIEPRD